MKETSSFHTLESVISFDRHSSANFEVIAGIPIQKSENAKILKKKDIKENISG